MQILKLRYHPILIGGIGCCGLMALLWTACSTEECYDNKNTLPQAGFYMVDDGSISQVSVSGMEVYGIGAPGDSVLSTGSSSVSELYLPLRIDSDMTSYVFKFYLDRSQEPPITVSDTVKFSYSAAPRFVSAACGVSYVYDIEDIRNTGHMIDSVVCVTPQVTNAAVENFRIYIHYEAPAQTDTIPESDENF